ncbi:MAG: hypothetical protein ACR2OE_17330 [Thermomicrobiales bacterium]
MRWSPFASELGTYAGPYWGDELGVSFELIVDRAANALTLRRRKFEDQTFVPLAQRVFGRGSLQFGTVLTFEQEKKGKIGGLLLTASRIRNLRFIRREG